MLRASGVPTLQPMIHYDWSRKFFRHQPEITESQAVVDTSGTFSGTVADAVLGDPDGLEDSLYVAHDAQARPNRRRVLLWHGERRLVLESLGGFFDGGFRGIRAAAVNAIAPRLGEFVVLHPQTEPTFVVGRSRFLAAGVSHETLERLLDAPVAIASEGWYSSAAWVPSLRVYVPYDGTRYKDSSKKIFYDRNGNGVPVELVAREVLQRLGYEVAPPSIMARIFFALVGRPTAHFRPETWGRVDLRRSPFARLRTARRRLQEAAADPAVGVVAALEALGRRKPYSDYARPDGALPLVSRFLTRRRLEDLLQTLGSLRFRRIMEGFLGGHRVVAADWFAWQSATKRAFPVEVKSTGDTLRPSQKESILFCQASGVLDYRLLELLHHAPEAASSSV